MDPLTLPVSYFVLGISYLAVASFSLWKGPIRRLKVAAMLVCYSIAGWAFFSVGMVLAKDASTALFWAKLFMAFAVFIPFFNLLFIHSFLSTNFSSVRLKKRVLMIPFVLSLSFLISDVTPFLLASVSLRPGNFYFKDPGFLYHFFELYFSVVTAYCAWLLFKVFQASSKGSTEERKSCFLLCSLVFSYFAGGMSYLLAYNQVSSIVVSIGNYGAITYSLAIVCVIKERQSTHTKVYLESI